MSSKKTVKKNSENKSPVEEKESPDLSAPKDINKGPKNLIQTLSEVVYYEKFGTETKFESQSAEDQKDWLDLTGRYVIALDKINKRIVSKNDPIKKWRVGPVLQQLTAVIVGFLSKVKTVRCKKCGNANDIKAGLFPSAELAHEIIDWVNKEDG